jgi:hypothetical protein
MITLAGQLAIKTIHGRNGDFNVGRLATSIGEFTVKNPELDQYPEGKYDGDFIIAEIRPSMYNTSGRMVIELRAHLGGMTLSNIDALTRDEAGRLSPQEVDPIDEESEKPKAVPATTAPAVPATAAATSPLIDSTPFGVEASKEAAKADGASPEDAALFGSLWPLSQIVKLDATVNRRLLRQQRDRLGALGYEFAPLSQDWHCKAA